MLNISLESMKAELEEVREQLRVSLEEVESLKNVSHPLA